MNASRFMGYVRQQDNGCWIWTGGRTGKGYGKCWHNERTLGAHVVSHLLFKGEIEPGLVVRHKCNVKLCVNPDHLIPGTYKDNLEDARVQYGSIGRIPEISRETIMDIFRLRSEYCSSTVIALKLNLPIDYVTGVIAGHFRKDLKTEYETAFGPLPKFHAGEKYTLQERAEMVRLYTSGELSAAKIAKQYGTTYKYVWKLADLAQRRGDI